MIVMTIVLRNEAEIIRETITHYLDQGIDRVIAIDNGSTDGTSDILDDFVRAGVAEVILRTGGFDQASWGSELVRLARDRHAPDWVIAPDSDEFIVAPGGETLAAHLARHPAAQVIECHRVNLFPTREDFLAGRWRDAPLYRSRLVAQQPNAFHDAATPSAFPYFLYGALLKVIFRPAHFKSLMKGAHLVELDPPARRAQTGLVMWHVPMRQPDRFAAAIERRIPVLDRERHMLNLSNHYRRWARMLRDAQARGAGIEAVLPDILPDAAQMAEFAQAGIVARAHPPIRLSHIDGRSSKM